VAAAEFPRRPGWPPAPVTTLLEVGLGAAMALRPPLTLPGFVATTILRPRAPAGSVGVPLALGNLPAWVAVPPARWASLGMCGVAAAWPPPSTSSSLSLRTMMPVSLARPDMAVAVVEAGVTVGFGFRTES
jgi:hypothetical protein